MAIAPINNVSFNNYSNKIHFNGKNQDDENGNTSPEGYPFPRRSAHKLATVPIVVMMSMSPSLLNAATATEKSAPLNVQALTELAETQKAPKSEAPTYVMAPQQTEAMSQGQKNYFQLMKDMIPFKTPAGSGAYISFVAPIEKNNVTMLEYIPKDLKYTSIYDNVPRVMEMVYHKTGDDKEYCGLITRKEIEYIGDTYFEDKEQRITDDAANAIIDLINGDSKYTDETGLMVRVVNTPKLTPTKIVEPSNK